MSLPQVNTMPPQSSPASVYVLGVRVDRISQQEALDRVEQMVARRRASGNTLACQQIVTVNPEFVMAAQRNKDFCVAINSASLVLADGIGVVWATRYLGRPTPERVTGSDMLPELARLCA
ncbi:MAG TPA: WecB/TagA/CpsF family glycosyltransferase, partial [Ktedonobacteraceae bacterium]|nr:WecB/TagA/CpsF family glycosyltransferase [Ktedonobacteraceae bacterium]